MTKISEIIENFAFKTDPRAIYPREEILEKFARILNSQKTEKIGMYNSVFVARKLDQSGIKNAALMCWFYDYCLNSKDFSESFHNLLQDVDKSVD